MPLINPKDFMKNGLDKEIKKICQQMNKIGKAYSHETKLPPLLGQKLPKIFNGNMIDVTTTRYRRKNNYTIYIPRPDVIVRPEIKKDNKVVFKIEKLSKIKL